ncbi:MAG: hypothetical protein IPJ57_20610, partial [Gemmatimonadetes bacterium]|nr:hypothetical protein [Gemmatimonadota bacterium]
MDGKDSETKASLEVRVSELDLIAQRRQRVAAGAQAEQPQAQVRQQRKTVFLMTRTRCLSNHSKQGRTNGTKNQQNWRPREDSTRAGQRRLWPDNTELAESAGLTASQVRDNAGVAKKASLLTIEQDEMT